MQLYISFNPILVNSCVIFQHACILLFNSCIFLPSRSYLVILSFKFSCNRVHSDPLFCIILYIFCSSCVTNQTLIFLYFLCLFLIFYTTAIVIILLFKLLSPHFSLCFLFSSAVNLLNAKVSPCSLYNHYFLRLVESTRGTGLGGIRRTPKQ